MTADYGAGFQAIWWPTDITAAEMVEMCRAKGMTRQEVADRCGVSRRSVTSWVRGGAASYEHKSRLWTIAKGTRKSWDGAPPNDGGEA